MRRGRMCDCSCERPIFFDSAMVRARKLQRCCECNREIRPGETYERATGRWPFGFATYATCQQCLEAWRMVSDCRCFTGLVEAIYDDPRWDDKMSLELIRVVERHSGYRRTKVATEAVGAK